MLYINDYNKIPKWAWEIDDEDINYDEKIADIFDVDELDLYDYDLGDFL